MGNAPTSTCLQGRCIACLPRPQRKTGKSPWCCPRQAGFWRPCRTGWCATYWKIKRAGVFMLPARALAEPTLGEGPAFQQRTNTSWRSTRSQPAVSRRLFRCLGAHLLRSPSIVKSLVVSALLLATGGRTTPVERDRSLSPNSVLRSVTSFRCRLFSTHSFDPFVSLIIAYVQTKNPAHTR